jgi:sensor histidine kinase YesM
MGHPILSNTKNLLLYILVWLLILGLGITNNIAIFQLETSIAIIDSTIFITVYATIGIGLWYNLKYKNFEKINPLNRILYHIAEAFIITFLWILLCHLVLKPLIYQKYTPAPPGTLPMAFIFGLVFYTLLTLFYYLVLSYRNLQEKIQNELNLQSLIKEAELSLLKSQINPHFLFNSLNSISSLTISDPEKAREMIIKLSDFLRHSIGHKELQMTTLKDEIEHIVRYLDIEKIRFGDRLRYNFDISESCKNIKIPIMLFQPLFENAIKHGVYESTEPITIQFACIPLPKGIKAKISNNFDPEAPPRKGNRMGIKNVENRLKLIYQTDDLLKINKNDHIFEVELIIPSLEE